MQKHNAVNLAFIGLSRPERDNCDNFITLLLGSVFADCYHRATLSSFVVLGPHIIINKTVIIYARR